MRIDIWSDVVCPFCFIGKRTLENALKQFEHQEKVEIIWHSYELSPKSVTRADKTSYELIAEREEIDVEDVVLIYDYVEDMAKEVGLSYSLEKLYPVNTRKAHRLLQVAKAYGKGEEAEELFFNAYFTEFRNVDSDEFIEQAAERLGISLPDEKEQSKIEEMDRKVREDIELAHKLKISEVPYFLFDNKMSIKGVQSEKVFLEALNLAWENHLPDVVGTEISGRACSVDGHCE